MGENLFSDETTETTDETSQDVETTETDEANETETEQPSRGLQVVLVGADGETEKAATITADQAAEAIVIAAAAWGEAQDAMTQADVAFRQSALAVVSAGKGGVSDLSIAKAVQKIKKDRAEVKGLAGDLYSSPTSVGYHRRTGLVLTLDGTLPEGVSGRDVQTTIKGLSAKIADAIIGQAEDQCAAWEALSLALAQAKAAKAAKDAKDDEDAESGDEEPSEKIKDAAHMLKSALNSITKASEMGDDMWTDEAVRMAVMIADTLTQRVAVLPQATTVHLSAVV